PQVALFSPSSVPGSVATRKPFITDRKRSSCLSSELHSTRCREASPPAAGRAGTFGGLVSDGWLPAELLRPSVASLLLGKGHSSPREAHPRAARRKDVAGLESAFGSATCNWGTSGK